MKACLVKVVTLLQCQDDVEAPGITLYDKTTLILTTGIAF